MNPAIHTTIQQITVGGINNGINVLLGDVPLNNLGFVENSSLHHVLGSCGQFLGIFWQELCQTSAIKISV
jgi:hypothetical protein